MIKTSWPRWNSVEFNLGDWNKDKVRINSSFLPSLAFLILLPSPKAANLFFITVKRKKIKINPGIPSKRDQPNLNCSKKHENHLKIFRVSKRLVIPNIWLLSFKNWEGKKKNEKKGKFKAQEQDFQSWVMIVRDPGRNTLKNTCLTDNRFPLRYVKLDCLEQIHLKWNFSLWKKNLSSEIFH